MVEVVWTDEARSWLREIYDYIAADNESAAQQVIAGILEHVERLRVFPESGARLEIETASDLRQILYGHCRIV